MEVQTINFNNSGMYRSKFKKHFFYVQNHIHQCSEIVYVTEGELLATVNGETKLMRAGDVAVMAPFQIHTFSTPNSVNLWLCVFSTDLLYDFMPKEEIYRGRRSAFFSISPRLAEYISDKLPDSDEEMLPFRWEERRKIQLVLFSFLDEYMDAVPELLAAENKVLLPDILLYLDENYSRDISIEDVARALGYSSRHISRHLKDLHDYNFCSLLNSFRIEHAKSMIRNSDRKIIDISLDCGYKNERSFYRAFSRLEGITPIEYRRQVRSCLRLK